MSIKKIYVCGPTVYSDVHIGNMRPIITFDIFNRSLKALEKEYFFIHNITDIDDKIIAAAKKDNVSEKEISGKYEALYLELLKDANVIKPNALPRVTDNINKIINYIKRLIDKGNAYEIKGNVYFSVESIKSYGHLSNRDLESMRMEEAKDKKHPGDFALWKKTNEGVQYESPWSKGRPGWHTECALFISDLADGELDIHGGGIDLLFPHHENENAQNYATHGKNIAKQWMHVGHINMGGEKMSKSIGNVFLAKDFFKKYSPDALRYIFLNTSYSAPINLNKEMIELAMAQINKYKKIFAQTQLSEIKDVDINAEAKLINELNFAGFNKVLSEEIKKFNSTGKNTLKVNALFKLIGYTFTNEVITEEIKDIYKQWNIFREKKDFEKSDKLRDKLIKHNLI